MIDTDICSADVASGRQVVETKGCYSILEYNKLSGYSAANPAESFFRAKQGIKKRQVIVRIENGKSVILQAGAMQMMLGNIVSDANTGGVGGVVKNFFGAKVTGESVVKPKYSGDGVLILEPTWRFILLEDLADWGGSMVIDDGLFLSCESTVEMKVVARQNLSSAIAGGEGFFNTMLIGKGTVALESKMPRNELICIELQNDTVKIDGNMAIAWSGSLQFTVERSMKGLIDSAMSKEGFVNVYRGTGRILVAVT